MVFLQVGSLFALAGVVRAANEGPCDIFEAAATPCVAAHSTVRALYAAYAGPLYEVRRADDNATFDVMARAGVADAEAQDDCGASDCVVSRSSTSRRGATTRRRRRLRPYPDAPVNATREKLTLGGRSVYSLYFEGGMGYRNDNTSGVAVGDEPGPSTWSLGASAASDERRCVGESRPWRNLESRRRKTSRDPRSPGATTTTSAADYGNAETDDNDEGAGTMDAVYFGNANGGLNHGGAGDGRRDGPWIMADMENALWGADRVKSNESTIDHDVVTAVVKGDSGAAPGHWAIKGGDATSGGLATFWDGARAPGYAPMKKQGALLLGVGGDNSNRAVGTFYEGAVVSHYTTDATDAAVQANIVAAGYGK
ncbi:alpha-L-arabinofuranosidase [Aureococcus anophagefferens]|nr:alpha-L-arabinofuranosidase [Aureococcus anophagefferens]